MTLRERITAFSQLGDYLSLLKPAELEIIYQKAAAHNGWFTKKSIDLAFQGIIKWLHTAELNKWLSAYELSDTNLQPKTVGIVMAGNIPLVGFHDFLSILITGNIVQAKLSSQDPYLPKLLGDELIQIDQRFADFIQWVERLKDMDAIIATGSDNTSRYFDYYFGKYPHIIRKNRISCAIVQGDEHPEDFNNLGKDIFYYYGLGCRNVSKIYVPEHFDITTLIDGLEGFEYVMDNHKYANNYNYNRSIFLVSQTAHLDNGFCLFENNEKLASPTSVVYVEKYGQLDDLVQHLNQIEEKVQCLVSKDGWFPNSLPFGKAQEPALWDYADRVDTMKFIRSLA